MSLVESIFQTAGKACTMLVHFVLPSGFMILYKINIIKVGKISVTIHA